jgi:hypothetical protein
VQVQASNISGPTLVKTYDDLEPEEETIQELGLVSVGPIEQVNLREREERNQQFKSRERSSHKNEQRFGSGRGRAKNFRAAENE